MTQVIQSIRKKYRCDLGRTTCGSKETARETPHIARLIMEPGKSMEERREVMSRWRKQAKALPLKLIDKAFRASSLEY